MRKWTWAGSSWGSAMRTAMAWALYPVLLFGSIGAAWWWMSVGWRPSAAVMVLITAASIPLLLAQQVIPARPDWRGKPKDFSIDLLHMAITGLATEGWRMLTLGLLYEGAGAFSQRFGIGLWPTSWPVIAQFVLAVLVGEFLAYWMHRSFHRIPVLWRLHAVHHSSERMYVFAAARNHPMNAVLMHSCHVLPLAALGVPVEILALSGVFTGVHGLLQHCNVDLRHGWFNLLFATADLHRWHHSGVRAESDTNFGNNLILWDRVFGTVHLPGGMPKAVGLGDDGGLPENYLVHLAAPFFLYRLLRPAPATSAPE